MRSKTDAPDDRILRDEIRESMEQLVRLRRSYGGALAGYLRDDRAAVRRREATMSGERPRDRSDDS